MSKIQEKIIDDLLKFMNNYGDGNLSGFPIIVFNITDSELKTFGMLKIKTRGVNLSR